MSGTRRIPTELLDALVVAYKSDGDLREAVAPIVAMIHGTRSSYVSGCRCTACTAANTEYHLNGMRPRYAAKLAADPDSQPHGSDSTYTNYGCRCEQCRAAHAIKCAKSAEDRAARLAADPTIRPHGDRNTYTGWGCRCAECTAAVARYEAERYAKRKGAAAMT